MLRRAASARPASFFTGGCLVLPAQSVTTGVTSLHYPIEMATKPEQPLAHPVVFKPEADVDAETNWAPPAPAPIAQPGFDPDDTWMTFGLGLEGEEDDRTVTVVFLRPLEEENTDEFVTGPFCPTFPPAKRRR